MLERGLSLNNQLLTHVRIRSATTGIEMHVVQWLELTTLLVHALSWLFEKPEFDMKSERFGS